MESLNELRDRVHAMARSKGWHDEPRTFGDIIALCHSELSEALEEFRSGNGVNEIWYSYSNPIVEHDKMTDEDWLEENGKPEGVPIELADVIIRILDFCGAENIDIEDAVIAKILYNNGRPHRHGGKKI